MNKTVFGFQFIPELCIQCHACTVACSTWNNLHTGNHYRRVASRFEGEFPAPKLVAVSVSCLHCQNPACAEVCPEHAIRVDDHGRVLVIPENCVGCRLCYDVCPVGAPQFGPDGTMSKCDLCASSGDPACVRACPSQALRVLPMTEDEKAHHNETQLRLLHGK